MALFNPVLLGQSVAVQVEGWPDSAPGSIEDLDSASMLSHPVWGRLTCPALTRLNLMKQASETYLLRSLAMTQTSGITRWELELRTGLKWWDGDPFTAQDVKTLLERDLRPIVMRHIPNLSNPPNFNVTVHEPYRLVVQWSEAPSFGPYILNYLPVRKPSSPKGFQCVGLYRIQQNESQVQLILNRPSPTLPERVSFVGQPGMSSPDGRVKDKTKPIKGTVSLKFGYSSDFSGSPTSRLPDESVKCERPLDLPVMTAISWNPQSPLLSKPEVRQALTTAAPRGTLLRAGAGFLGDLVSAPILRAHPGYDRNTVIRPHDYALADRLLTSQGYRRPNLNSTRLISQGHPFELTIGIPHSAPDLLVKVLSDSFAAIGIRSHFVSPKSSPATTLDGNLMAVVLPWPDGDLRRIGLGYPSENKDIFHWSDPALNPLLDKYARSLSYEKPDFGELMAIHRRVYELEPFTILMQHRSCLTIAGLQRVLPNKIFIRNPDWFHELLQQVVRASK